MSNERNTEVVANWLPGNHLKEMVFDIFLLATLACVIAATFWLESADPESNWFMRSGAIIVLIGAVLEYRHNQFLSIASNKSIEWAKGIGPSVVFKQRFMRRVLGYTAHVLVLVGTFIAAYGDKIIAILKSL